MLATYLMDDSLRPYFGGGDGREGKIRLGLRAFGGDNSADLDPTLGPGTTASSKTLGCHAAAAHWSASRSISQLGLVN